MTEDFQVYKCSKCGNVVEVLSSGIGELVCCEIPMILLKENTVDASHEKHVPVIEKIDDKYKICVGSEAHPMEEEHYIVWIELLADNISYKQFLHPHDIPEASFNIEATQVTARAYCNKHGVWRS